MKFYPVVIPTLNRYQHFRNCVESLAQCRFANQTELVIGLDYPAKEGHRLGYEKIKAYLPSIKGFAKITIFERNENYGAFKNIISLIEYAKSNYDAYIVSEDDNIFAPTFLQFVNSALEVYRDRTDIGSVCGFTPFDQYNRNFDCLLSPDASAWGAGRWRDKKGMKTHLTKEDGFDIIFSWRKSLKLCFTYPACLVMLIGMCKKNVFYGDVIRTAYNITNGIFQIKPGVSLVRNMGHDGSGLHCSDDGDQFNNQELSTRDDYTISDTSSISNVPKGKLFVLGLNTGIFKATFIALKIWGIYLKYRILNK